MTEIAVRTGENQLDIPYYRKRLGSMANTTTCCASGTCGTSSNPDIKAPMINKESDPINAEVLSKKFGPIV